MYISSESITLDGLALLMAVTTSTGVNDCESFLDGRFFSHDAQCGKMHVSNLKVGDCVIANLIMTLSSFFFGLERDRTAYLH